MAATPYLYERQVEYWTSRAIEDYFLDSGFEVITLPLTQLIEVKVPADFIFRDRGTKKLFGFQFKVLYRNRDDFWNLNEDQHRALQHFDWMYYGLSDLVSGTQQRNALHYLRIAQPAFPFQRRLARQRLREHCPAGYFRWAAFYEGLQDCRWGRPVCTPTDLRKCLWPYPEAIPPREITEIANEVLVTDFDGRRAVRYSSLFREGGSTGGF